MPALSGAQMAGNWLADDAWCQGCGLHHVVTGEHRPDCTVEPSPLLCEDCGLIRLPSERKTIWRYDPRTDTYHCPNHQKGTNP